VITLSGFHCKIDSISDLQECSGSRLQTSVGAPMQGWGEDGICDGVQERMQKSAKRGKWQFYQQLGNFLPLDFCWC
jgi:hypothetical protein